MNSLSQKWPNNLWLVLLIPSRMWPSPIYCTQLALIQCGSHQICSNLLQHRPSMQGLHQFQWKLVNAFCISDWNHGQRTFFMAGNVFYHRWKHGSVQNNISFLRAFWALLFFLFHFYTFHNVHWHAITSRPVQWLDPARQQCRSPLDLS